MGKSLTAEDIAEKYDWWGYVHNSGSIQVKPFYDKRDLTDAHESGFAQAVYGPFKAIDREDAINIVKAQHGFYNAYKKGHYSLFPS